MMYAQKYSADDLFDMFANGADFVKLAGQEVSQIASDLRELAPDMEDADAIADDIKVKARTIALNHRFGMNRNR